MFLGKELRKRKEAYKNEVGDTHVLSVILRTLVLVLKLISLVATLSSGLIKSSDVF